MIRIQSHLIRGEEILYIEKWGFDEIRVVFKDSGLESLMFRYDDINSRDIAFENIDQVGRDYCGEVYN